MEVENIRINKTANRQEYDKKYNQKYYTEHKDYWKTLYETKIDCDCGSKYDLTHKARHLKSKKHQTYVDKQ